MEKQRFHLTQLKVGCLLHPLNVPETKDFAAGLEPINALAEQAPGFAWRFKDETGNATSFRPMDGDPVIVINMGIWEDAE